MFIPFLGIWNLVLGIYALRLRLVAENPTGNPVFDFRAGFRARAEKIQRALIGGGVALFLACGFAFLFAGISERLRCIAGWASLSGVLLCVLGIAWGFYWRKKLRADFRKQFGPPPSFDTRHPST